MLRVARESGLIDAIDSSVPVRQLLDAINRARLTVWKRRILHAR
jgi:hypothetical protein